MDKVQAHEFWPCPRCGGGSVVASPGQAKGQFKQDCDEFSLDCGDCGWTGTAGEEDIERRRKLVEARIQADAR